MKREEDKEKMKVWGKDDMCEFLIKKCVYVTYVSVKKEYNRSMKEGGRDDVCLLRCERKYLCYVCGPKGDTWVSWFLIY